MRVLVTGGAGYIGSVVVEELMRAPDVDYIVVLDNLTTGHAQAVDYRQPNVEFVRADIGDEPRVRDVFKQHAFDAVIHLAASALVGASMQQPMRYYDNNVRQTLSFLESCLFNGVQRFVFSSSGAVYGSEQTRPWHESDLPLPINPYGETKLAIERALFWYSQAHHFRHASLRYFNAAGATKWNGEDRGGYETHLIPNALDAVRYNKALTIHGDTYPTFDGTCVRDYVHVKDLARAHVAALGALDTANVGPLNLGSGHGYSVQEVLDMIAHVTHQRVMTETRASRAGDPATLVADIRRARTALNWAPSLSLQTMIEDAWTWRMDHPNGYANRDR